MQNIMVIVINGASGAGKTFLLNNLSKLTSCKYVPIRKYTTRIRREFENDSAVDLVFGCDEEFIESCDFHYPHNNEQYGIDYNEIAQEISSGNIPVIIIRSFKTIRDIKARFANVKLIFIIGASGEELRQRLIEQGRTENQIQSALNGAIAIMDELDNNRDIVDEFLFNQYDEEKYLSQFERIAKKEVPQ